MSENKWISVHTKIVSHQDKLVTHLIRVQNHQLKEKTQEIQEESKEYSQFIDKKREKRWVYNYLIWEKLRGFSLIIYKSMLRYGQGIDKLCHRRG